jgi:hypothetical protein
MRRIVLLALLLVIVLPTAASALTPEAILTGGEQQFFPAANDTYLAWTQNSLDHPRNLDAFARALDATDALRLNRDGTRGFVGGFVDGSNDVVYQQAGRLDSDIWVYDLDSSSRSPIGPPVNTTHWEFSPAMSSSFVLFQRSLRLTDELLLYDRVAGSQRVLDVAREGTSSIFTGQVGQRYATWTRCGPQGCFPYSSTPRRARRGGSRRRTAASPMHRSSTKTRGRSTSCDRVRRVGATSRCTAPRSGISLPPAASPFSPTASTPTTR